MSLIQELQDWYFAQCNDEWEHRYGVQIDTLDNPGWSLKVDLVGTGLEDKRYPEYSYGIGEGSEPLGDNWLVTKVEAHKFIGFGGPEKLEELIRIFLDWA